MKKTALVAFTGLLFASSALAQTAVTGPSSSTIGHPATFNNTLGTVITDTPVLGVTVGGTGQSTLSAHGVVVGEGTSGLATAVTGTPGAVLIDQGSGNDPQFKTLSGAVTINSAGLVTLGAGVVTNIATANGITGGPITSTGTLSLDGSFFRGYLAGNTLSGGGSQILTVSAGVATSDDVTTLMKLTSTYTKTFSAWSVGSGNGGLDTGAIATNTWYHVFIIERTDTGVVDVLISLSPTTPVLPTNYTKQRRIGSIRTNATPNIIPFVQTGDVFQWAAALDYSSTATQALTLTTFTVPTGVVVQPLLSTLFQETTAAQNLVLTLAPGANSALSFVAATAASGTTSATSGGALVGPATNTSAQIFVGVASGGTIATGQINSYGWVDLRGRFN